MRNTYIKSHQMTRDIASKYDVDYRTQMGLCLKHLINEPTEPTEPVEFVIINIWKMEYGKQRLIKQWEWDKSKDWKTEFLKRWGNLNGSQSVKDIIYNSQGLRIALKEISDNTDYTMVLGYNMYDERNYKSIDFKQSLKKSYKI